MVRLIAAFNTLIEPYQVRIEVQSTVMQVACLARASLCRKDQVDSTDSGSSPSSSIIERPWHRHASREAKLSSAPKPSNSW